MLKKEPTREFKLKIPENSYRRLEWIKQASEATSYTEVIRNALRLYEYAIQQDQAKLTLALKDADGNYTDIELFNLPQA